MQRCRAWLFQDTQVLLTAANADDKLVDALSRSWLIGGVDSKWYDAAAGGYRILVCDCSRMV